MTTSCETNDNIVEPRLTATSFWPGEFALNLLYKKNPSSSIVTCQEDTSEIQPAKQITLRNARIFCSC